VQQRGCGIPRRCPTSRPDDRAVAAPARRVGKPRHAADRCRLLHRGERAALTRGTDPAPHRPPSRSALPPWYERRGEPASIPNSAHADEPNSLSNQHLLGPGCRWRASYGSPSAGSPEASMVHLSRFSLILRSMLQKTRPNPMPFGRGAACCGIAVVNIRRRPRPHSVGSKLAGRSRYEDTIVQN
jgi:hypothetical protein